jgi:hypothetical protein
MESLVASEFSGPLSYGQPKEGRVMELMDARVGDGRPTLRQLNMAIDTFFTNRRRL